MGPVTLKAINAANPDQFLAFLALARIARYSVICTRNKSQKKFLLGWINRALEESEV